MPREHQVLPYEEAELVADVVEVLAFVGHRAADADHVHAGIREQTQGGAIVRRIGRESCDVQGRPADAATENRGAVDGQSEPVAVGRAVEIDRAESDAPEIYRFVELPFQECVHVIEWLRTMRVGPPALRRGNADRRYKAEEIAWQLFAGQRGAPVTGRDGPGNAAWPPGRPGPRTMTDAEIDVENAGVALEPSVDVGAFDSIALAIREIGFHGPTGAIGGHHPGMRPRSDVRNQRRFWRSTRAVRHLGRGRLVGSNRGASAEKRKRSSF